MWSRSSASASACKMSIFVWISLMTAGGAWAECCYNDKGYYDPNDFLFPSQSGPCADGTKSTPCCAYQECGLFCCGCEGGCRVASPTTTTTTTTPTTPTPSSSPTPECCLDPDHDPDLEVKVNGSGSGSCNSDSTCELSPLGKHSACDLTSCRCQCSEETTLYLDCGVGICVTEDVLSALNQSCTEDRECLSGTGLGNHSECQSSVGRCHCSPGFEVKIYNDGEDVGCVPSTAPHPEPAAPKYMLFVGVGGGALCLALALAGTAFSNTILRRKRRAATVYDILEEDEGDGHADAESKLAEPEPGGATAPPPKDTPLNLNRLQTEIEGNISSLLGNAEPNLPSATNANTLLSGSDSGSGNNDSTGIQATQVKLYQDLQLGAGASGVIFAGELAQRFKNLAIAAKTVKPNCTNREIYVQALSREIAIMKYLSEVRVHPNIVQLYGVHHERPPTETTEPGTGMRTGTSYMIMELCENGSLLSHLHTVKENGVFLDEATFQVETRNGSVVTKETYTQLDFLRWAWQIADAMEFVASMQVVHSDIACRNVLFFNRNLVKLSDFGLSRKLHKDGNGTYVCPLTSTKGEAASEVKAQAQTLQQHVPFKYCPPEIFECPALFSTPSDIWAFGVMLWEIFAFGDVPYGADTGFGPAFIRALQNGRRLGRPEFASAEIYRLMGRCWELDPKSRITFTELKQEMDSILNPPPSVNKQGYCRLFDEL